MEKIIPLENKLIPETCYVFKHSIQCPISTRAAEEVKQIPLDIPLYWINVIEQRPLSNWIAETYQVKHESPQLLRIEKNKVAKIWNHHHIKRSLS